MFRFTLLLAIITLQLAYARCLQTTRSFQRNIHITSFITNKQPERFSEGINYRNRYPFDSSGRHMDSRSLSFALNMMQLRKSDIRSSPSREKNSVLFYRNSDEEDITMFSGTTTVDGIEKELLEGQITLDKNAQQQQRQDRLLVLTRQRKTDTDQLPDMMYLPRHSSRNLDNTPLLSFEMIIGRATMVVSAFMFTAEMSTGSSFPEQVAVMLS